MIDQTIQKRSERDNRHLLSALVCPLTKAPLYFDEKAQLLISKKAHLAFPIEDGAPVMLLAKAQPYDEDKP